ncbi:MAG: class I SAM-dependent methyltransferase, partial [Chthoniobacterales bacterium]
MAGIVVKPRARILHGHDWVFSSEVLKIFGDPADGDVISLKDGRDRLIGSAIYNSKSQIIARRFSRQRQDLDLDFFKRRIAQAAEYRARRHVDPKLCRVVWSESDGLPGVIIDRYGDHFVLQTLTLAMDLRKDLIANAIVEVFWGASASLAEGQVEAGGAPALQSIVERNDVPVRRAEGLELKSGILRGDASVETDFQIAGVRFAIDLLRGQKTGFYLDQKANYQIVAEHAMGRRVLDCFADEGAFA